ncbi:MAG: OmpH family outer membrane protein [Bacteroidales bacterium]|jgi:outer membrane protein|nr:OmpH family outer membrane protein [Bacteroidales bacterium]MDD2203793.1 OmpH family outer membrane protein [Bacteroidales bacterium]MDD3152159.1 OmpH family outer membrane protein [Bacteroidales bacterium]MDD3913268.1 OmpH family outer membrane protein [Bacteroidales bacterium]MDD4633299.1 OmpH family outer membrane protein [Bacteroidales bacterium]
MKKYLLIVALAIVSVCASAQKFAFVDTDYILSKIPEYTDAQAQLDDLSAQWQKEIEAKFSEVDKLYKEYQANKVVYPEEIRNKKENEIIAKEKEVKEYQKAKFGTDGELYKKRQELVKPIQERVYNAIKDVAEKNNYGIIFNKSDGVTMIYTSSKYDVSDDVLEAMGYAY